ncbi:MAG: NUDIX domain-containing protein [bacterium]|nr:NUDIX domain-containing protein [bacterium]
MSSNEIEVIPTVGVVAIKDNRVLLVRHGSAAEHLTGVYGLPSGRQEDGESETETAIREFNEETGLETSLENLKLLPSAYSASIPRKDGTIRNFSLKVFLCNGFKGSLVTTEESIPEWVEVDKITLLALLPNVEKAVIEGVVVSKGTF